MWILGALVVSRALPSFSTSTTAPESATRKFAPLIPISAARNFSRSTARAIIVCFSMTTSRSTPSFSVKMIGHVVAGHVQRRRDDVVRPLVGELHDVLAQIGLHRLQPVMLQPLVEVDFLGGHRLRFHDEPRLPLLGQSQHEIGDLVAVLAVDHLAAMRRHLALELLEVVIQVVDGVLLDRVGLIAQFLILGEAHRW